MIKFTTFFCASLALFIGSVFAQFEEDPQTPAPIDPPIQEEIDPVAENQPEPTESPAATATTTSPATTTTTTTVTADSTRSLSEFQGDDVGQVLRLLARQAGVNLVVSDKVEGTVTMRLENLSPIEAIRVVTNSKNLILDEVGGVYYVKTQEEKAAEPTESGSYTFSYASAKDVKDLLAKQLASGVEPQIDPRTNTVFYREVGSNVKNIDLFLETIDRPTQQVMIEARLVEVTANPRQSFGINWAGVVGGSASAQTFRFGGSTVGSSAITPAQDVFTDPATGTVVTRDRVDPVTGLPIVGVVPQTLPQIVTDQVTGTLRGQDFLFDPEALARGALSAFGAQFAILSAPQLSLTLRLLNEDADAEFLAHPRVVTANNQQATIKIVRNQPVPQLNFNEQTATAVFGGFEDKEFGNTLIVTPSINKDEFVTLSVKPEVSNKVGDAVFTFAGSTVASPIIDQRTLESNVLIKSGDTLAIGGLLQDETTKARTKVPVLGDIPVLGYLFQERINARTKRNLLVFVTPTIIRPGYGTGLEDQINGLTYSGEEYAEPTGWRNNARGAIRVLPTSHRQNVAEYPIPGTPVPPRKVYKTSAFGREK